MKMFTRKMKFKVGFHRHNKADMIIDISKKASSEKRKIVKATI